MPSDALRRLHEQEHVCLAGNGTTALYLTLSALDSRGKRVGFAANVCTSVPMAVSFSGNEPVFLDIDAETMTLSMDSLRRHVRRLDVLIAVYPYGAVFDIHAVRRLCAEHNVFLIEDCAVAQGATIDKKPVGSFGDACIVSFGTGKIIDAGHGGAVLTSDSALADAIGKLAASLPAHAPTQDRCLSDLSLYYNELYNRYFRHRRGALGRFKGRALSMKRKCLCRFDNGFAPRISAQLDRLGDNIARRERLARAFESRFHALQLPGVETFSPPHGSVYWRFNLFVQSIRDDLLYRLLAQGYRISSWYPAVSLFWSEGHRRAKTPVCDRLSESILNLWVNQDVDEPYIDDVSSKIARFVEAGSVPAHTDLSINPSRVPAA